MGDKDNEVAATPFGDGRTGVIGDLPDGQERGDRREGEGGDRDDTR